MRSLEEGSPDSMALFITNSSGVSSLSKSMIKTD